MDKKYARAYTEVLELLKHIPEDEVERIPKAELQFYENNCDKNYRYEYNAELGVDKQVISKEANTVIIAIYMNHFANEDQKSVIEKILKQSSVEEEKKKAEKYDVDKIFERNRMQQESKEINKENLPVDVSKSEDSFIRRIINKIKSLFKK